jgi:hypothetical protein
MHDPKASLKSAANQETKPRQLSSATSVMEVEFLTHWWEGAGVRPLRPSLFLAGSDVHQIRASTPEGGATES